MERPMFLKLTNKDKISPFLFVQFMEGVLQVHIQSDSYTVAIKRAFSSLLGYFLSMFRI